MTNHAAVYQLPKQPLLLKQLIVECDIQQGDLAAAIGVSRTTINACVNRDYQPHTMPSFRADVEKYLKRPELALRVQTWLRNNNAALSDIWSPGSKDLYRVEPPSHGERVSQGKARSKARIEAMCSMSPEDLISNVEVEMITQEARKHFKLFRDPFPANGGVEKDGDIFMSDEHRYIEAAMMDAAKHSGLLAIVGQVGSGKSVMRKRVFEQLRKEGGILTVFPQILDKDKITASVLCDAIVLDVSDEKPRIKHEHKARQVKNLLLERSRNGDRCCLVIEEAHNLTVPAFKILKQLWELEDGYNKLLSIILIGQTELGDKLNERHHPEMREVIRRIQIANIQGLNGNMSEYLGLKFKRVGASLENVFTEEALDMLSRRLTSKDERGKSLSYAYPLTVNLYAVRAINLAAEMGESKVTAEVVEAI